MLGCICSVGFFSLAQTVIKQESLAYVTLSLPVYMIIIVKMSHRPSDNLVLLVSEVSEGPVCDRRGSGQGESFRIQEWLPLPAWHR